MATVSHIVEALAERTRPEYAPAWDPIGLQLGDPEDTVGSVAVCHEVTEAVIERLETDPVDLLVTYHPLLFQPTNRLISGRSAEARAFRLIRIGVNVLVTHTDFDCATGGAADALASEFKLRDVEAFGADEVEDIPPIGRVGLFDGTLGVLDAMASDSFGSNGLRVTGSRTTHVDRVAVVPGSGSHFIEEASQIADALVTGDVSHHRAVRAADLGLAVIDPGHIATEKPGMGALVRMVDEIVPVSLDLTTIDPTTWS